MLMASNEDRRVYDPWAPAPAESLVDVAQSQDDESPTDRSQLPNDLDDISRADLIALAKHHKVAAYGSKEDIATRIREAQNS